MPCKLLKDPSGLVDVVTSAGTVATVFVRSDAAPAASVIAARLSGVPVPVTNTGRLDLPALQPGTNLLTMTVEGIQAGDDIQLVEDCGGGETSALKTKFAGSAPGGADPVVTFRIHAS